MSAQNRKSRTGLKVVILLALLVGGGLVGFGLLRPEARVAAVVSGKAVNAVPGSVTVTAEYIMELKSEADGRMLSSELDPGLRVAKGGTLVEIDSSDLQLEIERIENDFRAAKARIAVGSATTLQLATAQDLLRNGERLFALGSMSETEIISRRRAVEAIQQQLALEKVANDLQLATFENTLKVKRNQLERTTIKAPFDGVVSAVAARPGDLVSARASVATLISINRTVEGRISQENFAGIRLGQKATVRFLGRESDTYQATIDKILPTADAATQRYLVYLKVDCPAEVLIPGLTGEVSVIIGERQAQALIPRRALFGDNLFVVRDGRAVLTKVELGYVSLNMVEVTKGLAPGDLVIVEELDRFRDGARVKPVLVP
jgi:RND family efflux transporter MFP subunit